MIPKRLSNPEMEAVFDQMAEAVDAVAEDQRMLFLAKLAFTLANMLGDPAQVAEALSAAAANLERFQAAS